MSDDRHPPIPPGWSAPLPAHLPRPTASPSLFAFGVVLVAWGIISSPLLDLIGGAVLFYALFHWVWEIVHEAE